MENNKELWVKIGVGAGKVALMGLAGLAQGWLMNRNKELGKDLSGDIERGVKHFIESKKNND